MIDSPQHIRELLENALDHRSRFILALPSDITINHSLYTTLVRFEGERLFLEASSLKGVNPKWLGQEVTCYFCINTKKGIGHEAFYNFRARITDIGANSADLIHLCLDYPQTLNIGQRRSSIRIEMDHRLLKEYYIWEEDKFIRHSGGKGGGLYPPLLTLETIRSGAVKIQNISAGGLKKRVTFETLSKHNLKLRKGHSVIIRIVLLNPEFNKPDTIWVKAKVIYRHEDFVTRDLDMGMGFTRVGRLTPEKKIKWIQVRDNNIDQIGNWTYRRYLEEYRKGLV